MTDTTITKARSHVPLYERAWAHFRIMRFDHTVKQVFILPGTITALTLSKLPFTLTTTIHLFEGLLSATLIASSNYVINELLDASFDRQHPTKCSRPAALGLVNSGAAYLQWIVLMVLGLGVGSLISVQFQLTGLALWLMGCAYNIRPVRSKDVPYVDVLSESINNPLRFLFGWYIVTSVLLPPTSLLIAYWMTGAYFMALKRFSEYRQIGDPLIAKNYRKSFGYYTEETLLSSVMFYASIGMLFFGAFIIRYRRELILSFPLVGLLMAVYFRMSFRHESAVQNPEKLYREPQLMLLLGACVVVLIALLCVDIPWVDQLFPKTQFAFAQI